MADTLRVLMVEDSVTDTKLIIQELQALGRPIEFERVETAQAMRAALDAKHWDFIISDWSMPRFSARAALAIVKEAKLDLPFIIVSGTIGEDTAVEAMRAGAHDCVLKDKLARLTPAIERELRDCKVRVARRQAEDALRESQARFHRLAESGILGITTADANGNILDANDAYLKIIGYSREELLQGALRRTDLTPPEFRDLDARAVVQLQTSGITAPFETESFRKDGSRVPILVGAATLEYPKSISFVLDLSDRKRAEAERALLATEAREQQVAREQAEEALRQSEGHLRQAQKMEAVGRLAGGVAHDFNNVLSVILSYGELILGDLNPSDPLRMDIEEIRKAAIRAAGLTRQLLTFSRQQVVEPRVINLNDVLLSMNKMLQRILGEDVELVSVTPTGVGRVKVDPSHIEQVILNLVVNARDAMPTGGKLTIETANILLGDDYAQNHVPAKAGRYVMMAVSDTGIGMDRETQRRIFEPFFTTKEQGKGTGLGLSTVFGIVQQSSGNIWVYSELGKGTTFKIYLPRMDAEVDSLRPQVTPTTLRGTETILLVEDEEQVRTIVLSILTRQGYRVLPAQHAGEALLLCERHPETIDLLLTDVVMPQMSGPELAKRLASTRPQMKVLCMSGYTDDSIVRHGVLEAGVAFIQKPITPSSLARKVRAVLDEELATTKFQP
jgi:two-component system, cell cycle sensor histidine kinase and response regulator CckA